MTIDSTPIDRYRSCDYYGQVNISDNGDIPHLKLLADEAHRYGAKLSIELQHAGRAAHPALRCGPALSPSVLEADDPDNFCEITHKQMEAVKMAYAAAAG